MTDGAVHAVRSDHPKGSFENPLSRKEVEDKFRVYAKGRLPASSHRGRHRDGERARAPAVDQRADGHAQPGTAAGRRLSYLPEASFLNCSITSGVASVVSSCIFARICSPLIGLPDRQFDPLCVGLVVLVPRHVHERLAQDCDHFRRHAGRADQGHADAVGRHHEFENGPEVLSDRRRRCRERRARRFPSARSASPARTAPCGSPARRRP